MKNICTSRVHRTPCFNNTYRKHPSLKLLPIVALGYIYTSSKLIIRCIKKVALINSPYKLTHRSFCQSSCMSSFISATCHYCRAQCIQMPVIVELRAYITYARTSGRSPLAYLSVSRSIDPAALSTLRNAASICCRVARLSLLSSNYTTVYSIASRQAASF